MAALIFSGKFMAKRVIFTENAPSPIGPYSQAVWGGNLLFISGQIAINPESGELLTEEGIEEETRQVMENLKAILTAAGLSFDDVVKTSIFLEDMGNFNRVNELYSHILTTITPPPAKRLRYRACPKMSIRISMIR